MAEIPMFVNQQTVKLRCPLLDFQDCVQERCFFWLSADRVDQLRDAIYESPPPENHFPLPGCFLEVTARRLSEPALRSVASSALAGRVSIDALAEDRLRLRQIEAKLDLLLKRTEKP